MIVKLLVKCFLRIKLKPILTCFKEKVERMKIKIYIVNHFKLDSI